jgi:hypothetical protein
MLECGSELSVGSVRIRNESVKHDSFLSKVSRHYSFLHFAK